MIKNYLLTALRRFRRNKVFSLINISGLAIGISAALVIYLIVQFEFSFNKYHHDGNRIYRIVSRIEFPDLTIHNSGVPVPTAKAVRNEATGIEGVTHFMIGNSFKVSVPVTGNQSPANFKKQAGIIYADEEYFKVFNYQWISGHPQTVMNSPFQAVLTESRAKTYFANLSPATIIGRTIYYDDSIKVTIAGVVKDIEQPTDFAFKEFISRATIENTGIKNHWNWEEWGSINSGSQLFVKLIEGTQTTNIEKQLASLRTKYRQRRSEEPEKDDTKHFLQPLKDIHFNPDYDAMNQRQAHKPTLFGLLAVASFLLLLGCINFINLTTALASQRAKEIGIRKTMGSGKRQLIFQFLSETLLLTILATILSVVITPGLLNVFSDFIPPGISFASLNQVHVWFFLTGLIIVVTLLSGFYPALVLTKFKPVTVLKNQAYGRTSQTRKAWLRKTLTVTQFVIAQFLIIATIVVSKQIHYSLNKELGYKRDAIVQVNTPWNFFSIEPDKRRFVLLEKLKAIPEIEKISLSGSPPASGNTSTTTMKFKNGENMIETMVEIKYADTAYFDLFKMKLLAGKNLQTSDTIKEFVINETYAKLLGFKKPGDAVGQFIERDFNVPVTGVISDFHTKSTHQPIKPLAFAAAAESSYTLHLALRPQRQDNELWKRALTKVEKAFKEIYPEDAFEYNFYNESIASFYKTEQNISRLLKWSAGLCIFISCLGLLGLVIYTTTQRLKEIGVRKVLGASVSQIVTLLSKDFLMLVIFAFIIAAPLAWLAMNRWLEDYAYRTNISWWVFALSGAGMLVIALLTLSFQTLRSATVNPVKSLRTE